MPPSAPPRRFAPEPVETSARSSKDGPQQAPDHGEQSKPRRFPVEPLETTVTSSKIHEPEREEKSQPRRFAVQPVETEHKSSKSDKTQPRRFAVEPVETEHKSSKDRAETGDKPVARRFEPQLQEMSATSSKDGRPEKPGHIRFLPEPVETLHRTNRKARGEDDGNTAGTVAEQTPRKFAPILIDTAKRSRRTSDEEVGVQQAHKTESGHLLHAREHRHHIDGDQTPAESDTDLNGPADSHLLSIPPEMRRHVAPMDGSAPVRRPSVQSQRTHSFRCPELDTIESSESERGSNTSSLSSSPSQGSPITASDSSYVGGHKHATRIRESVDGNFAQYLLELEAKKAEQRLRELAEGAFPNTDFHEPVQHYMDRDDESDELEIEDRPVTYDLEEDLLMEMAARRESTAKANWEQAEMQRHHEQLEQERNAARATEKQPKQPSQSPWWNPAAALGLDYQDSEMRSMRDRARPPMLGSDLVFPRCPSPDPARFDVTQGSTVLRNQMCYLTEHAEQDKAEEEDAGLWHPPAELVPRNVTITTAPTSPTTPKMGLWGGFCVDDGEVHVSPSGLVPPSGPTGLLTPKVEHVNPFEQSFAVPNGVSVGAGIMTPPTPPRSIQNGDLGRIDTVLSVEQNLDHMMETEFPDSFITQVYNYLSLGYPSLAKPFDEELSKISRVPIKLLREDDRKAKSMPRGYIRLGGDFEGGGGDGQAEMECMRWRALKLYVREWARQEGNMVHDQSPGGNWGQADQHQTLYRGLLEIEKRKVHRLSEDLKHTRQTIAELEQEQLRYAADAEHAAAKALAVREDERQGIADELQAAQRTITELRLALGEGSVSQRGAESNGAKRKRSHDRHDGDAHLLPLVLYQHRKIGVLTEVAKDLREGEDLKITFDDYDEELEAAQTNTESIDYDNDSHTGGGEQGEAFRAVTDADMETSRKNGLLSMLKVRSGTDAKDLLDLEIVASDVQAKILQLGISIKDIAKTRNGQPRMRCLRSRIKALGPFHWTKLSPGSYACLTSESWELLPLLPEVRPSDAEIDDTSYFLAPVRRLTQTKASAVGNLRSLWQDDVKTTRRLAQQGQTLRWPHSQLAHEGRSDAGQEAGQKDAQEDAQEDAQVRWRRHIDIQVECPT
ncbi:hypothetical protein B0A55_01373 [Friedmanniomyces simplex]|uniref:Uncharacterized protein n=1 Tax=Friedmanniomyces simplex TaxID=329884 RepID=A0A4U0Y2I3_9PEZI|nr:hypothetical protein B0A55_01373 [Friedmanniomyces simplex]